MINHNNNKDMAVELKPSSAGAPTTQYWPQCWFDPSPSSLTQSHCHCMSARAQVHTPCPVLLFTCGAINDKQNAKAWKLLSNLPTNYFFFVPSDNQCCKMLPSSGIDGLRLAVPLQLTADNGGLKLWTMDRQLWTFRGFKLGSIQGLPPNPKFFSPPPPRHFCPPWQFFPHMLCTQFITLFRYSYK